MNKMLVLDIETYDPYIDRGLSDGWVFKANLKEKSDYKIIGIGIRTYLGTYHYLTNFEQLKEYILDHNTIICHNAQYDIGGLLSLGISVKNKIIIDTILLAKLYNNTLYSYKLDDLGKLLLNQRKTSDALGEKVKELGLMPLPKSGKIPDIKKFTKFAKSNMRLLQQHALEEVSKYCLQDVKLTWNLYSYFQDNAPNIVSLYLENEYSILIKAVLKMRLKGVRIDLNKAREIHQQLIPKIAQAYQEVYRLAGREFNIRSNKDVPEVLKSLGIKCPKSAKGGDSATSDWLESLEHPIGEALVNVRKLLKFDNDFIQKLIEIQQHTLGLSEQEVDKEQYGRLYPKFTIFGATVTGRFSSSSPNLQQIPSRDEIYGPLCRSIFLPEQDEQFAKLDYSNQEGRIQIHYASKLNCEGAEDFVTDYKLDPYLDHHQKVADLASINRKEAKTINLGLSYGMGQTKLARSLGLSEQQGKQLLQQYNEMVPYLKDLNKKCSQTMELKGYIKTLSGRSLRNENAIWKNGKEQTFEYKALNKLAQGSAADQTIKAIIEAYKIGLPVLFTVHDEFCMSISNFFQAYNMRIIMETCIGLTIPVVADLSIGENWGKTEKVIETVDNVQKRV